MVIAEVPQKTAAIMVDFIGHFDRTHFCKRPHSRPLQNLSAANVRFIRMSACGIDALAQPMS
jgi:hypothetical protein